MDPTPANVLSLATGAGGLDLGLRMALPAARLVCAVEVEAYACEVLASRMEEGLLDDAPIWTDLRTFRGSPWRGVVDIVSAGYPCQPFSHAGRRRGAEDPRHLWPEVLRVVRECEPELVVVENVAGHLTLGFEEVRGDLLGLGYEVEAGVFAAVEAGAPHRRQRLFALAHHHHQRRCRERRGGVLHRFRPPPGDDAHRRCGEETAVGDAGDEPAQLRRGSGELHGAAAAAEGEGDQRQRGRGATRGGGAAVGDDDGARLEGRGLRGGGRAHERAPWPPGPQDTVGWREYLARWPGLEPALRRDADGMADRLDRLRLTGNGVVPAQAALALTTLARRLLLRY